MLGSFCISHCLVVCTQVVGIVGLVPLSWLWVVLYVLWLPFPRGC